MPTRDTLRRCLAPAGLALIIAAQAVLFLRIRKTGMDFDEGFYLASLAALRHGQTLGTQVFAPQPPGFYYLLRLAGAVSGPNAEQVREAFVGLAALASLGLFALARGLGAGLAALLAPALLMITPPIPEDAARVWADLPCLWVALIALGLASLAARRGRAELVLAGLAGGMTIAAISVKFPGLLIGPVVLVLLLDAPARRARIASAIAGASAVTAALLIVNWAALGDLWQSDVVYHRRSAKTPPVLNRRYEIEKLFDPKTPYFWLLLAGGLAVIVALIQRRAKAGELGLWLWAGLSFLFLLWFSPLHYNHLVYLPVPLATAAGVSLGRTLAHPSRWRFVASIVVALALVAGWVQQLHRVDLASTPNTAADVAAAAVLDRATTPAEYVVTDLPAAGVLAHRVVPGPLVELGNMRFETHLATPALVLKEIDSYCAQAVVAGRAFTHLPTLINGLEARYRRVATADGASVYLDRRQACSNPTSAKSGAAP